MRTTFKKRCDYFFEIYEIFVECSKVDNEEDHQTACLLIGEVEELMMDERSQDFPMIYDLTSALEFLNDFIEKSYIPDEELILN
jgi:hypothetical protein